MKFYDREKELDILQTNWAQTEERGRMTVLIGRRRIGKTTLLTKSAEDGGQPLLYLYVSKDNERVLTGKFQEAAEQSLGLQIFGHMETFAQFFEQLLQYGRYVEMKIAILTSGILPVPAVQGGEMIMKNGLAIHYLSDNIKPQPASRLAEVFSTNDTRGTDPGVTFTARA